MNGAGRASFEWPYGLSWLLQLAAELRESNDPLYATITPLEDAAIERLRTRALRRRLPLAVPGRDGRHRHGLSPNEFAQGLTKFMPRMTLTPAVVTDPSDPKLAHLDGLNLSRAWT